MPIWFRVSEERAGLWVIQEPGHVNSFLVCGREKAALIDSGMGFCPIRSLVESLTSLPVTVLNTHWHFDHIGGNREFGSIGISRVEKELSARPLSNALLKALYLDTCPGLDFPPGFNPDQYEITSPLPNLILRQGHAIDLGGRVLEILESPGHTRGSLSFLDRAAGSLFCGDLVYDGTLYAQFTDSDLPAYRNSLERLTRTEIDRLYVSHNAPVLGPEFLDRALDLVERVLGQETSPTLTNGWGEPVLHHAWKALSILTPMPDSGGINLLACGRNRLIL